MRSRLLLLFAVLLCGFVLKAENTRYQLLHQQALNQTNGLVSNEVNFMLQDSKGFMWFGTNNGLSRYDGYRFKTYKSNYLNPHLFTSNIIRCLAEDQNSRLWIGTAKGVNMIDLRTGKLTLFDHEIKNLDINAVVVSANNTVYFGTSDGLYLFNEKSGNFDKIKIEHPNKMGNWNYIKALFIDSKNYLWIGGWETGYLVYNLNTNLFVEYPYLKELDNLIVNHIYEDVGGSIWLSTWNKYGVWRIENPHQPAQSEITNFQIQKCKKSTFYPVVYAICEERGGENIVLATSDGIQIIRYANRYNGNVVVDKTNSYKISGDEIYALCTDRTGLIWYSIHGIGINAISTRSTHIEQFNLSKMIDENNLLSSVTAIYQDDAGLLWIGLKSFVLGLFDRNNNHFELYNNNPVIKKISSEANAVYSFYKPPHRDELWLGTRHDGLYVVKFNNGKINSVEKKKITGIEPRNLAIRTMVEDTQTNTLWIGTNRGIAVARYQPSTNELICQYYNPARSSNSIKDSESINTLLIDKDRNLWIGTNDNGIFKASIKGDSIGNIEQYAFQNGKINNSDVLCSFKDHKKRLWVGTKGGGLSLYNKQDNRFTVIDNMERMPDDAVYAINEDNWGNLWLATGNGLVCYNEDFALDERIKVLSTSEGLNINTFNQNSSFRNDKNELFFGGKNGFVSFAPSKREVGSFTTSPVITGVYIANSSIDKLPAEERKKILDMDIPYTDRLNLSYQQNNIQIDFSVLLFENNTAVKYAYKLEGVDKDWVYVKSNKNSVNYNNLSSGKYVFSVKGTNADGVWCQTPTVLNIKITPAPWRTTFAYIVYAVLLSLLIAGVLRFAFNQFRLRRLLAIEQVEREKSEEVHQAKLRFFTNISHEFFTPITIIKCAIDGLTSKNQSDKGFLQTIDVNTDRLVRLLDQIIEFRKVETGNVKLKLSQVEFVSFIRELCYVHFGPLVEQRNISFSFHSNRDIIEGFADCDKMDKIVYNLLSNAIKYNREGGSVQVEVDVIEENGVQQLLVMVEDTGYGMNSEIQKNIFKRFYEGNFRDFKVKSIGIGLSLTYDLVKLHNGDITVESEENVGSKFVVTLPINKQDYIGTDVRFLSDSANYYLTEDNKVGGETEWSKLKILLVEDNKELLELMSDAMRHDFSVLKSENGKEALKILEEKEIDVLITDILMPEIDGVELVREIKKNPQFSHIPVIMLSARHNMEHKIEGYESGADSYLTKPFEIPVLIANIKSLVKNRKLQAESFSTKKGVIEVAQFAHNDTDKEFLEKVIQTIETNVLEKDFTTNDLYEAFQMSQSTFYRKLQALIGVSPNELIKKVKINIACQMLSRGNLSVSEVAYDLGFSDPKYFSSVFKKEVGVIPSEYMKENSKKS